LLAGPVRQGIDRLCDLPRIGYAKLLEREQGMRRPRCGRLQAVRRRPP
jgi:hypothetical protein